MATLKRLINVRKSGHEINLNAIEYLTRNGGTEIHFDNGQTLTVKEKPKDICKRTATITLLAHRESVVDRTSAMNDTRPDQTEESSLTKYRTRRSRARRGSSGRRTTLSIPHRCEISAPVLSHCALKSAIARVMQSVQMKRTAAATSNGPS